MKFYLSKESSAMGVKKLVAPLHGDAGYDIRSAEELEILPGEQAIVRTGLFLALPIGWVGLFRDRSSWASQKIYVHSGVIDASYRGEVKVIVENGTKEPFKVHINDKIVQMVVVPHYYEIPEEVSELQGLGESQRGSQGFGSTGAR